VAGQCAALVVEVVPCTLYRMIHGICALSPRGTHDSMASVLLAMEAVCTSCHMTCDSHALSPQNSRGSMASLEDAHAPYLTANGAR
jgi:hypothetical protein